MPRFYCPLPLTESATLDLPSDIARHINVLRLKQGDEILLFNGQGGQYRARLSGLSRNHAQVSVELFEAIERELPYWIAVAQGLPESSKMDLIIEKAVELGVSRVSPVQAERSVVKLTAERAGKRLERWKNIVIAAAEQCGRNRLCEVTEVLSLADVLDRSSSQSVLLLTPDAENSLSGWAMRQSPCDTMLLIGPEGGFSKDEQALAIAKGAIAVNMGMRVLRTETAALAAVSAINAIWESRW